MPKGRRSRRLTRARQLGVPIDLLDLMRPAAPAGPLSPIFGDATGEPVAAEEPCPAPSGEVRSCCAAAVLRHVSSGGTVFMTRVHTGECPAWSVR